MKWGYNWELGPFETWDALGRQLGPCERMKKEGMKRARRSSRRMLAKGEGSFYGSDDGRAHYWDVSPPSTSRCPIDPRLIYLPFLTERRTRSSPTTTAPRSTTWATACCVRVPHQDELHRRRHHRACSTRAWTSASRATAGRAWSIGNNGETFSAGANVFLLLMAAQQDAWAQVERSVKEFQDVYMRLKYSPKPTVAAPFAMALGGGAELSMGADRICAHADLFMGLVEVGVGLIPGGGGHKELLIRNLEGIPESAQATINLIPFLQNAFECIGMAKVSMSADEATTSRFLRSSDKIVTNKEHLLGTAKRMVQAMALEGYKQPQQRKLPLPGEMGYATFRMVIDSMAKQHQITEHEQVMASKLAWVLCGGKTSQAVPVSEQYLLDLEREAFCFLLGTPKTPGAHPALPDEGQAAAQLGCGRQRGREGDGGRRRSEHDQRSRHRQCGPERDRAATSAVRSGTPTPIHYGGLVFKEAVARAKGLGPQGDRRRDRRLRDARGRAGDEPGPAGELRGEAPLRGVRR